MRMQFDAQRSDDQCRHPTATCQVIELRHGPVGRLWLAEDTRRVTVLDISPLAALRGQGIGGSCLRRVQRRAAAARLDVEQQVVVGNPARRLYERLGFRGVGAAGVRQAIAWTPALPAGHSFEEMHHGQA